MQVADPEGSCTRDSSVELTTGIDLAAQARNTAMVTIHWERGRGTVTDMTFPATDQQLLDAFRNPAGKVGVDCPLGWPVAFSEFIHAHGQGGYPPVPTEPENGKSLLEPSLLRRVTDRYVLQETGVRPLSVSADLMAHVAVRMARLQGDLARLGADVGGRDGSGWLVEVYPAAALARWGIERKGYKKPDAVKQRREVLDRLKRLPGLRVETGSFEERLIAQDHPLDALISAIVARDAQIRGVHVPEEFSEVVQREGWIHLP